MLRQRPQLAQLRTAVLDDSVRYVPIAGTHGWRDAWCTDDASPFARTLAGQRFAVIRAENGRPFRWSTDLNGLRFWDRNSDWEAGADALAYFLEHLDYSDRNLIAHSHGGQVALILASQGFRIRSLTTVGTPRRGDVNAARAKQHIGFWQHVYDRSRDWIALLGQIGDGELERERSFRHLPGVVNHALAGIDHSKVLRDAGCLHYWTANGWLESIRAGELAGGARA